MELKEIEKIIKEETVYQGKKISVRRALTVCPSTEKAIREKVVRRNGVAVFALTEKNEVITEYIWRYAFKDEIICLPSGKIDEGESYEEAAERELKEESGYEAEHLESLGAIKPAPAYSDEEVGLFFASGLREIRKSWDKDEYLLIKKIPLKEFSKMVNEGKINDARTLLAYYRYCAKQLEKD